jgi:hypothetical protein
LDDDDLFIYYDDDDDDDDDAMMMYALCLWWWWCDDNDMFRWCLILPNFNARLFYPFYYVPYHLTNLFNLPRKFNLILLILFNFIILIWPTALSANHPLYLSTSFTLIYFNFTLL